MERETVDGLGNVGVGKPGTYGGFEKYRGDPRVLDEALEHIKKNQPILTKISGDDKIILRYGNVTDHAGRVDTEAFAMTKGRTITLNRFMYDDTAYLIKEYADCVKSGHFAKGTDYKNIIDHEVGHVFAHKKKSLIGDLQRICEVRSTRKGITRDNYIRICISKYAVFDRELPAELNAMLNGNNYELAYDLLREAHLI